MNASVCGNGRPFRSEDQSGSRAFSSRGWDLKNVLYWESGESYDNNASPWNDGTSSPIDPPPPQSGTVSQLTNLHGTVGGNIGFFDGHVEWWEQDQFTTETQKMPGKLWCNPETVNGV